MMIPRKFLKLAGICVVIALVIVAIVIIVIIKSKTDDNKTLAIGAVVSNGGPCAEIGLNILKKYGSAIDSIIATMLCDGVTTMNNMGIGGGFIATIYIKSEGKAYSLNARETAPKNSNENMYEKNANLSQIGGLSVAIPGEVMGYWEMHKKFGKANWSELFQPTIELCKNGVPINRHIATNILTHGKRIRQSPTLYSLLKKPDGSLPKEGDKVKLPQLANTLSLIAEKGPDVLYNGSLSQLLIDDINNDGGNMVLEDLANYTVRWDDPVTVLLKNGSLKMYSVPAPASGPILGYTLSLLDGLLPVKSTTPSNISSSINLANGPLDVLSSFVPNLNDTFVISEAFKYAYAIRSHIGDPHFHSNVKKYLDKTHDQQSIADIRRKLNVEFTSSDPTYYGADFFKEDHGTANMAVLAPNGDAVVATSTINLIFGSGLVSEKTGIILNDEMDDFSTPGFINFFGVPPSTSNFISPGARPQSSMCPSIFVDSNSGEVQLAVGAAGGTRITTATALVALRSLWYNVSLPKAIKMPRFHHQLIPMEWIYDPETGKDLIEGMEKRNHKTTKGRPIDSCVTGILKKGDLIEASSDLRRPGNVSYILLDK